MNQRRRDVADLAFGLVESLPNVKGLTATGWLIARESGATRRNVETLAAGTAGIGAFSRRDALEIALVVEETRANVSCVCLLALSLVEAWRARTRGSGPLAVGRCRCCGVVGVD